MNHLTKFLAEVLGILVILKHPTASVLQVEKKWKKVLCTIETWSQELIDFLMQMYIQWYFGISGWQWKVLPRFGVVPKNQTRRHTLDYESFSQTACVQPYHYECKVPEGKLQYSNINYVLTLSVVCWLWFSE